MNKPTALVTGASRGIGQAIALALADAGFRVAIHYSTREAAAHKVRQQLVGSGHVCLGADLMDTKARETLFDQTLHHFKQLDVLVNNAGIFQEDELIDLTRDQWSQKWQPTIELNLTAASHLTFLAAQHMAEQGKGRIINITSRGAFRGEPRAPEYGASKAGLNAVSQSFAQAYAAKSVWVFAVAPGFVETDMAAELLNGPKGDSIRAQSPLGRVAQPQEVGNLVAYLAVDAPAYLSGAILDINGASYLRN